MADIDMTDVPSGSKKTAADSKGVDGKKRFEVKKVYRHLRPPKNG